MILNVGARTDIVQYFSKWFLLRLKEGYVYTRNPLFSNKVTRYDLSPDKIDAILFCSKNYRPLLSNVKEIVTHYRTYFYYTITAYGQDIEPNVPSIDESIDTLIALSKIVGKEKIAWRYDPILLTQKYTIANHLKTFDYMAKKLAPYIDRCIFSFVEMYKKLEINMPELIVFSNQDKEELAKSLGMIAKKYGIWLQTCGTNGDFSQYGIHPSGCATLEILGKANRCLFKNVKHKGLRKGCHCIESRDIGAYDTCLNGCKYCYANQSPQKAYQNYKFHDPKSPLLLGHLKKEDILIQGNQKSFLQLEGQQCSLFEEGIK